MPTAATVPGYTISDLTRAANPAQQLPGALFEVEVPVGPVAGGYVNLAVGFEQLSLLLAGEASAITLGEAQLLTPRARLYAISSYPASGEAPNPDAPPPTWNNDAEQHTVLVQGLPGGHWATQGLLVADSGSKSVEVDVAAGAYALQGAGTVTKVNGISPDGTGNVPLPERDPYAIGDNAAVTAAIKAAGHNWSKGDLIAFGTTAQRDAASPPARPGQPSNVLVGTANVAGADTFDGVDSNGDAWRYEYRRRNDGTYGWTRIGKPS